MEVVMPGMFIPPPDNQRYRWSHKDKEDCGDKSIGLDADNILNDYDELEEVLNDFPKANYKNLFWNESKNDGRYKIAHWWFGLFEKLWQYRGMENALTDFYIYPDEAKKLTSAIANFYKDLIRRCAVEGKCDGIFIGDDMGTQTAPFFSEQIFVEFFKPLYRELIAEAHKYGMQFWLHCCGNIKPFIPHLIEVGLDVLHPIQKYTMDERDIAETFKNKITFWAGFDVQQTIPFGSKDDVVKEVKYLYDTYLQNGGKMMFTAGNGINGDCPIESLKALYETAFNYNPFKK